MFHPDGPTFAELMRQALSSTDRGYDLLAPKFDVTPFRTPDAVIERALAVLGAPVAVGADLACGTGAGARQLRRWCTRLCVGVDRSEGMLAEAIRRGPGDGGHAPMRFVRGDVLALPLRDASLDAACLFGAQGHILPADEPRQVAELARVLRPGGRFVFVTFERASPWRPLTWAYRGFNAVMYVRNALISPPFVMYYLTFPLPRARALFEAAGFSVEASRGVLPEPFDRLFVAVATRGG